MKILFIIYPARRFNYKKFSILKFILKSLVQHLRGNLKVNLTFTQIIKFTKTLYEKYN